MTIKDFNDIKNHYPSLKNLIFKSPFMINFMNRLIKTSKIKRNNSIFLSGESDTEKRLPDVIPQRSFSGGQLMENWKMDAYDIINLIKNHGLLGYDSLYSVPIDKECFHSNLIADLTIGDYEQQKMKMNRFRFHPDLVLEFEKNLPESYEHSKDLTKKNENAASGSQQEKRTRPSQRHTRTGNQLSREILNHESFLKLISGSSEDQKEGLRRLRFDLSALSSFEKKTNNCLDSYL